jgi:hypothetical protein
VLLKHAIRIKCRATDRCGEILREIPAAQGKRTDLQPDAGSPTRFEAARDAGLSHNQTVTALRVGQRALSNQVWDIGSGPGYPRPELSSTLALAQRIVARPGTRRRPSGVVSP